MCRALWSFAVDLPINGVAQRVAERRRFRLERTSRRFPLSALGEDVRYGLRLLRRAPALTISAVTILATAIAANAVVFSLANALLFRPLTSESPERLVRLYQHTRDGRTVSRLSFSDYADYRDRADVFRDLAASNLAQLLIDPGTGPAPVLAEAVSANYFRALSVRTSVGRLLDSSDDRGDAPEVAVLSDRAWRERFGGDAAIVGRTLRVAGQPMTIIGVAPRSFGGIYAAAPVDLWIPIGKSDRVLPDRWRTDRDRAAFAVIGRLRETLTHAQAAAALDVTARALQQTYPSTNAGERVELVPGTLLHGAQRRAATAFFTILLALTGLVLVIAAVNVASLMLARAIRRRREMAVRFALGASWSRVVGQMLTESAVLASIAGTVGWLAATWASRTLTALRPFPTLPLHIDVDADARLVVFIVIATAAASVVMGLVPAFHVRRAAVQPVRESAGIVSGPVAHARLQSVLVVAQLAGSIVLAVAAGLLARSLVNARAADLGFDPRDVVALDLQLPPDRYDERRGREFYERAMARVRDLGGVAAIALANRAPLDTSTPAAPIVVPGLEPAPGERGPIATYYVVGEEYFDAIRLPLVRGRRFTPQDRPGAPFAAIVNETFARRFWPDRDPLGQTFRMDVENRAAVRFHVIGVARDARYLTVGEDPQAHVYVAVRQHYSPDRALLVRTAAFDPAIIDRVQTELRALDPDVQGFFARTLVEHTGFALIPARLAAAASLAMAGVACVLALVGLYGVVSYLAMSRTPEIALRIALGASPRDVRRLVLSFALRLIVPGAAAGLILAVGGTRALRGLLYGVSPTDATTLVAVLTAAVLVALAACALPVRRAMRLDPSVALKEW